jgi:peptidoglycan/LPS O-acetylase OafA/YrhL
MTALTENVGSARVDSSSGARFYRPELDCLRFFAFFAVFVFHSPGGDAAYYAARHVPHPELVAGAVSAGRFGVDLFFLLSAYLITELLLREQERFGQLDVRKFYLRRILRIWPLYFLGILIAVALAFYDPVTQYFPLKYAAAFALLAGNWLFFFGVKFSYSVMMILWSVSFEEQFYLLWPAFMAKARSARARLWAAGMLLLISTIARLFMAPHARALTGGASIFTNSLTRLDPIAVGIMTALFLHGRNLNLHWLARLGFFGAGCAVCVVAGHFYGLSNAYLLIGYPAVALGVWSIFRAALGISSAPRWLRYLGKISYGLYVFHTFALYLAEKAMRGDVHNLRSFIAYWCLALALTITLAALSYRFFETPFLDLKERFARVESRPV